jgi:hypothetical protein
MTFQRRFQVCPMMIFSCFWIVNLSELAIQQLIYFVPARGMMQLLRRLYGRQSFLKSVEFEQRTFFKDLDNSPPMQQLPISI